MSLSFSFCKLTLVVILGLSITSVQAQSDVFDATHYDYGAKPDNVTDNNKAFSNAWVDACNQSGGSTFLVPSGTYLVSAITFLGPCNGPIDFKIQGVIQAPSDQSSLSIGDWIAFRNLEHLTLTGGTFSGQGPSAWKFNQCSKTVKCNLLPVSIRFDSVENSTIQHVTSIDSEGFHINIFRSTNLNLHHLNLIAPEDSPNTDGIHISSSDRIYISNSNITTGDDCVSIGSGSTNINVTGIFCGPGHGISIGSLEKMQNEANVSGVLVKDCNLSGTSNGLRIKTWAPSSSLFASNISYENISMVNVKNPIIIDQQYCPNKGQCGSKDASRVQIRDVRFKNVHGVSSSEVAVNLQCSPANPCQNADLNDIDLTYSEGAATSSCSNVNWPIPWHPDSSTLHEVVMTKLLFLSIKH